MFGSSDPTVLARSVLLADHPEWEAIVAYSIEGPSHRLICFVATMYELQVIVEPVGGASLREACDSVWSAIGTAFRKTYDVRLKSLVIVDGSSGDRFAQAATGLSSSFGRRVLLPGLVTGVVYVVWLGIGLLTFAHHSGSALVEGAIPGIVLGAWSVVEALRLKGHLVWSE